MSKLQDLTGIRYGRLTVVSRACNSGSGATKWLCQCDCGNEVIAAAGNLKLGRTKSCGCLRKEIAHGKADTRLHRIWTGMKTRCYNAESDAYDRYGGRGIEVCEDWKNSFVSFYEWAMANGYADNLTIDRIDNDGNYSPENCRWSTKQEQNNNRRCNRMITYNGKTQNVAQWARELGLNRVTLQARLTRYGWSVEKAFSQKE